MATYYVDARTGNDSNNGLLPSSAWRSLAKVAASTFAAGDTINLRRGQVFVGEVSFPNSGTSGNPITIQSWGDGVDNYPYAIWSNADTTASNPNCLKLARNYIHVDGMDFRDAKDAAITIYQTNNNNIIRNCRFEDVGVGPRIKGDNNTVEYCQFYKLKMSTDVGTASDVGGVCVSIERNASNTCTGNVVRYCLAQLGKAFSVQFNNDGGFIEIFRGADNISVYNNVVMNCKGFLEAGGDNTASDTITNAYFYNNLIVNCYGILAYFNTFGGSFGVDVDNMIFENNTIYMSDRSQSAVFWAGNWTGLSTKFIYQNNIWQGVTTFTATDGTTDLNSITHRNNLYRRIDGSSSFGTGYTLNATTGQIEYNAAPGFESVSGLDFRLATGSAAIGIGRTPSCGWTTDLDGNALNAPVTAGCFQTVTATKNTTGQIAYAQLKPSTNQSTYPLISCNDIQGGRHVYDYVYQMWAIPTAKRMEGMRCYIRKVKLEFELASNQTEWLIVPRVDPYARRRVAKVRHEEAANTAGGTAVATTWNIRTLNVLKFDHGVGCRLSGTSGFLLQKAGTYLFNAWSTSDKTNGSIVRLYDVTNSVVVATGGGHWAGTTQSTDMQPRIINAAYTISGETTFRLEHYTTIANATVAGEGLGKPMNISGTVETYAEVTIEVITQN